MALLQVCSCGALVERKPCAECLAGRYARQRAHTDRKHRPFRLAILARDGWRCHWCGGHGDTLDYVVALVNGGAAHDPGNAVAACRPCNSSRGARGRGRGKDRENRSTRGYPATVSRVSLIRAETARG